MKKNVALWLSMLGLVLLCACTTKENNEKPIMTPTPTVTVAPTETPVATPTLSPLMEQWLERQKEEEYIDSLETIDWTELDCYMDAEESRRNSNLLNYGWLTYDASGNIYYINQDDDDIYVCGQKGEDLRLLCENQGAQGWLQLSGEWLYFRADGAVVKRVHVVTGEIEQIMEEGTGSFIVEGEKIITHQGYVSDLNGQNGEQIPGWIELGTLYNFLSGNDFWIQSVIAGNNQKFIKAYLFVYDENGTKVLKQHGGWPLLAGNYFSMADTEDDKLRHVWNLKTKEHFEINSQTDETIVSDGTTFYYKKIVKGDEEYEMGGVIWATDLDYAIYKWSEETGAEEIWRMDSDNLYQMYLTPTALYFMPQMTQDGKYGYHLLYYILETGETGQIY